MKREVRVGEEGPNMGRVLGIVGFLLAVWAGPSAAERDVAATLVGRWEGKTEVRSTRFPPERVLIIKNVRQDASHWKADGLYGVSADRPGRVEVTVTVVGSDVTLEFITPLALHVTLKLVSPNVLEGTHRTSAGHLSRMRLETKE